MNSNQAGELQARWMAGERLTPAEENALLEWIDSHAPKRAELLLDVAVDNQLRMLARTTDHEAVEQFVSSVMEKVDSPGITNLPCENDASAFSLVASNQRRSWVIRQEFVAVAAACVVLIIAAINVVWWRGNPAAIASPPGVSRPVGESPTFASIAEVQNAVWRTSRSVGDRLPAGLLHLAQGEATIRFDKGTIFNVQGPAVLDLKTSDEVHVQSGIFAVSVPQAAIGFVVQSPIARIVDLGTEFDVRVDDVGQTEAHVRLGKVTFQPRMRDENVAKPIELTATGLDRAVASLPDATADIRPVTTIASGTAGQFLGVIHADGETMEFDSRMKFESFQNRIRKVLRENSSGFREQWKVIVETTANGTSTSVESSVGGGVSGNLNLDTGTRLDAQQMLRQQLDSIQKRYRGNQQMQELINGMKDQLKENESKDLLKDFQ